MQFGPSAVVGESLFKYRYHYHYYYYLFYCFDYGAVARLAEIGTTGTNAAEFLKWPVPIFPSGLLVGVWDLSGKFSLETKILASLYVSEDLLRVQV